MNKKPCTIFKRILVTGATGFLGHHIVPALKKSFAAEIIAVGSRDFNLLHPGVPEKMMSEIHPDCIVHLAAKSGGIIDNKQKPADYYFENIVMNTHMFQAAFLGGVKKFMALMGGCSYPAAAKSPIGEDQMWNGFPQIESAGYSMAKKMLLVQSWAYRQQHGFNSIVLIPGNVYGEWDNFNLTEAHAIPALIRKCIEAKDNHLPSIAALGTGRPIRDFVYAGDVAAVIPWFLANYNNSEPVNISTGTGISIHALTETVKTITGYSGEIQWDPSQPDGQLEKIFAPSRLHQLGLKCPTPLADGLRRTVEWFMANRAKGTARL
ncbi:MAG: NAD-dependent epimerase/dehydratase family protein [Kiritimatiellia bacterium]|nr:NAD-dependent epimerase/dehydratase family protein [Kiritimatiellia bacterium]